QSDGGEDDKPGEHQEWAETLKSKGRNPRAPWKRQIGTLEISDQDFITDNGEAVWSILDHKNIDDVLMVGVHTNMCVLGRPFGLRQLSKNGKNVVLVRDLTDTMYNPDRWPFVDHYQGNRLIHQHIERFVCGTITSDQILGGKEFRFKNDKPRKCVVICAESIYSTEITLKTFSENVLQRQLGFQTTLLTAAKGEHEIPGLEKAVGSADLVILSIRRRSLPAKQLETVRRHLELGKPIVAIRTSSHAFDTKGNHPEGHAEWQDFDSKVLGCDYTGHYPNQVSSAITVGKDHAILTNVKITQSAGSLYKSKPLGPHCTVLLYGKIENHDAEPIAWTNQYRDSRIFYTSLGHKTDFENPGFTTLLENGIRWATEMKIGTEPSRKK
ncbi:MAG: ThuA domain-containing protein, partial [Planctomycetota bacterium]|nr:ThuA domain-containing protein [Planctomycetota bacterium]